MMRALLSCRRRALAFVAPTLALLQLGCSSKREAVSLAKAGDDAAEPAQAPPPDGPRLIVTGALAIFARPERGAQRLGEARLGAELVRSAQPVSQRDCAGGWYTIRPRGFACASDGTTLDRLARIRVPSAADLSRPLPFRYARARADGTPVYPAVPAPETQRAAEPDLKRHLERNSRAEAELLGPTPNDVPLDPRGVATGPPVLMPGGEGVDPNGRRVAGRYFVFDIDRDPAARLPIFPFEPLVVPSPLRKGAGVAVVASHEAEGPGGLRRFAVLASGARVPVDRLRPALATTFRGIDLDSVGLPVAFVLRSAIPTYSLFGQSARREDDELERRTAIPMTGRFRTVNQVRYDEAREGFWVRARDVVTIVKRSKFPEFARDKQKWLDVSVATQTLTAYEGRTPIYATLISSGRDVVRRDGPAEELDVAASADGRAAPRAPDADLPVTSLGTFKVTAKSVTGPIDPREVQGEFEVSDAPWMLHFAPGHALVGTYWSDPMGEAQSHHNVTLSPIDARRLWLWADPPMPDGWHHLEVGASDPTTIVYVRR